MSVVIPARDAQAWLPDCLASVHGQTGRFELQTIVVDDGSRDATVAIARGRPGVTCLSRPHRGPSAARNVGIAAAQGDFVAFLDADDLWPPAKLGAQLQVLHQRPDAALVFGDCRQFDAGGPRPRTEFEAPGRGAAAWGAGPLVPDAYGRLLEENFVTTGSVVLRRAVLAEVGGFAEDLRLVEDLDLWLRIARRHPIAWCDRVCLLRRRHDANTSRDPEAMGLAFLEVLRRQVAAGIDRGAEAAMDRAMADAHLQLAELALSRGQWGLGLRRAWQGLRARPTPQVLWRAGKATARVAAGRGRHPA